MRLSDLKDGQEAVVVKILGYGAFRKRLIEMGFVRGKSVKMLLSAPLRDPVKYSIMDYEVSLRRSEAQLIEIVPMADAADIAEADARPPLSDCTERYFNTEFDRQQRTINVALIGNPNCGKTSLFNIASGAKEHVGNYSGVTVDAKSGTFEHGGYHFNIVDLPGTYSLAAYSPEELYVRRYLRDQTPDVIINVVVASNLERNLYLTTELIDMDRSMVIALNMYDELKASGLSLDHKMLGGMIGVPIVPTVCKQGKGIDELFDTVIRVYEGRDTSVRHVHVNLGDDIEAALNGIKNEIKADGSMAPQFSPRYLAIKFLEQDSEAEDMLRQSPAYERMSALRDAGRKSVETLRQEDITSAIAAEKYGFIDGALAETLTGDRTTGATRSTTIIDAFVTNRLFGIPLFLCIMLAIFWLTFQVGSYPMAWIESGVDLIAGIADHWLPEGPLHDMICDGVIGGVGSVIVFLPNILILYFCISFMEDSGYMARAAFIMDRAMHKIGLHGTSFIPLVMGFGCNVPSIMSSRTIESRSSRLITILINPFMSCSARLPLYVLMIGTFFSAHAALAFFGIYVIGVAAAVFTARLMRRLVWKKDETPFVMELPPYRVPTLKATLNHTWGKGKQYLKKMGGIILVACIIVWALDYFPRHDSDEVATASTTVVDDAKINPATDSYLEMIGKVVNPVMEPLGLHWRASVAAVAGVPAKEIVVSTLGVLYTGDDEANDTALSARLTQPSPVTGRPDFTPASALAFMVLVLLYCPCVATLVAIVKETGTWRYGAFTAVYNTVLAWILAFITYNAALLCGL
jgi:ferrous iron transport protein B